MIFHSKPEALALVVKLLASTVPLASKNYDVTLVLNPRVDSNVEDKVEALTLWLSVTTFVVVEAWLKVSEKVPADTSDSFKLHVSSL